MTKVEGLLRQLHQRYNTVETYADLCALLEAGRAEGVEQEREKMLADKQIEIYKCGDSMEHSPLLENGGGYINALYDLILIPASVLAPKETP